MSILCSTMWRRFQSVVHAHNKFCSNQNSKNIHSPRLPLTEAHQQNRTSSSSAQLGSALEASKNALLTSIERLCDLHLNPVTVSDKRSIAFSFFSHMHADGILYIHIDSLSSSLTTLAGTTHTGLVICIPSVCAELLDAKCVYYDCRWCD